jgi:hypothetical protein
MTVEQEPTVEAMHQGAAAAGVPLTAEPHYLGGFLRRASPEA